MSPKELIQIIKNRLRPRKKKRFFLLRKPVYFQRHIGKDFLILATGPGIKTYRDRIQAFIKEKKPIVIATNFIDNLCIPEYHMFNSRFRFCNFVKTVHSKSTLLLVPWCPKWVIKGNK